MIRRKAIFNSIRTRIMLLLLVFIFLPTFSTSMFMYTRFSDLINKNSLSAIETALGHAKQNITLYMHDIENTAVGVMTNESVVKPILKADPNSSMHEKMNNQLRLESYLLEQKMPRGNVEELAVFSNTGTKYCTGKDILSAEEFYKAKWYTEIQKKAGKPYWGNYFDQGQHFFVARQIRDLSAKTNSYVGIGTLMVSIGEKEFYKLFSSVRLLDYAQIMVVDSDGIILSHKDKSFIGKMISTELHKEIVNSNVNNSSVISHEWDGGKQLSVFDRIPNTRWGILITVPTNELYRVQQQILLFLIIISSICILGAFVASALFMYRLTAPLKKLAGEVRRMIQTKNFSFSDKLIFNSKDEIEELGQDFSRMLADLNDVKNSMHQLEISKKEAELESMKSKINPHFLYNTLESIRMSAVVNKDHSTADMVKALADMFRFAISSGKDMITLKEEISHLQNYILVQKHRYENRVHFSIAIGEELMRIKIPKMVLQPLVENALIHGIDKKRNSSRIEITAVKDGEDITISVFDDGAGINADRMNDLKNYLDEPEKDAKSIGLRNVHQRIKLFFGDQFGLSFESEEGKYTRITIKIPDNSEE